MIHFVACIEAGWLEYQTLLMVRTLVDATKNWPVRKRISVVKARRGPNIAFSTQSALEALGCELICKNLNSKYAWKPFLNKHTALAYIEQTSDCEIIAWLDSDMLVLRSPELLLLKPDLDFVACTPDSIGGTSSKSDSLWKYWQATCDIVGIDLDSLPDIRVPTEGRSIKLYFNSGVFSYRRSTGLSCSHLEKMLSVMHANIASSVTGNYFTQHILGLCVHRHKLRWSQLPVSYNCPPENADLHTQIVHYHQKMWQPHYYGMIEIIKQISPNNLCHLERQGPLKNDMRIDRRLYASILKRYRHMQANHYSRNSKIY